MRKSPSLRTSAVVLLLVALAGETRAGFTLVTDPSQLNPTGSADWSALGSPGTSFTSPATFSSGGANLTLFADSHAINGQMPSHRIDLESLNGNVYATTFTNGELAYASLTVSFDSPVQAVGAMISASVGRQATYIAMELVGADGGTLPHFFSLVDSSGPSNFAGYAGIRSDQANIYGVRFLAANNSTTGSAVVRLGPIDFESVNTVTVPAPSGFTVLVSGIVGVIGFLRGRSRKQGLSMATRPPTRALLSTPDARDGTSRRGC